MMKWYHLDSISLNFDSNLITLFFSTLSLVSFLFLKKKMQKKKQKKIKFKEIFFPHVSQHGGLKSGEKFYFYIFKISSTISSG